MTPVLLQQFRLFYAQDRPIGVVLWGTVSEEVEGMLSRGTTRLRPQDWRSGERFWPRPDRPSGSEGVNRRRNAGLEVIAPFGGAEEMVKDLKTNVFPDKAIKYVRVTPAGKKEVAAV